MFCSGSSSVPLRTLQHNSHQHLPAFAHLMPVVVAVVVVVVGVVAGGCGAEGGVCG